MAKTTIGILNVKLNAQTAAFGKGLNKANRKLGGFKTAAIAGVAVLGAFSVAAVRAGRGLVNVARETAQFGDDLLNASNKIGIATDELQALRFMGRLTSVENSKLDASVVKLTRSIGEAVEGNKEYADTFERLNLNAHEMSRMTPDRQVRAFADALRAVETPAEKVAASMQLMGRGGADLLPLLNQGSAGLDKMEARFRSTGAAIDNVGAGKLAAANAELETFSTTMDGVKRSVGGEIAPTIAALGESFRSLGSELQDNGRVLSWLKGLVVGYVELSLDGIGAIVQGVAWLGVKVNRVMASIVDGAAAVHIALQRINPVSDMNTVRSQAQTMNEFADMLRDNASKFGVIHKSLSKQGLYTRYLITMKGINSNAGEFADNLQDAAVLQREIGRMQDQAKRSGADQFEQVVRSRISIGGVREGQGYARQTVDLLAQIRDGVTRPRLGLAT